MSANQKKESFLNRIPKQIKASELEDGRFLLPKEKREEIAKLIKEKSNRNVWTAVQTKHRKEYFYIDKQGQAYVKGPLLGEGNFGKVHMVQNALTGKWQCMKILESGTLENAELEILAQEGMYVSSEASEDFDLFVGELIHGEGLRDIIKRNQSNHKLSFEQALAMGLSLMEAYESLHRKGFVHRDIKPENVMFDTDQRKCIAIDFGTVVEMSKAAEFHGTPAYVPYEIIASAEEIDDIDSIPSAAADIYALGLTLGQLFSSMTEMIDFRNKKYRSGSPELKERNEYIKSMDYFWDRNLDSFKGQANTVHTMISHVLLGAISERYQKDKNLSKEQIALFKIIYNMSGKIEGRPSLLNTIQAMQKIRLEHITNGMTTIPDSVYKKLLEDLFAKRDGLKNAPHALDDLDGFLLRMVDSNLKNRPSLNEVDKYRKNLIFRKNIKQQLNVEIHEIQAKDNLNKISQRLHELEIRCSMYNIDSQPVRELQNKIRILTEEIEKKQKSDSLLNPKIYRQAAQLLMAGEKLHKEVTQKIEKMELEKSSDEKIDLEKLKLVSAKETLNKLLKTLDEQTKILGSNPIVMYATEELQYKINIVNTQIDEAIKSGNQVENSIYDKVTDLAKIVQHHNNTVNLKMVVQELKDKNLEYVKPYRSGQKNKKKRQGTLIFANKAGKYDNAEKLEKELTQLMEEDILDPKSLQTLIQKFKDEDLKTMGVLSSSKDSAVAKMFREAEAALATLTSLQANVEPSQEAGTESPKVPGPTQDRKPTRGPSGRA